MPGIVWKGTPFVRATFSDTKGAPAVIMDSPAVKYTSDVIVLQTKIRPRLFMTLCKPFRITLRIGLVMIVIPLLFLCRFLLFVLIIR